MPVLDSTPNELNSTTTATPYNCKDRIIKNKYYAPDHHYFPDNSFETTIKFIPHIMSKECHYDHSLTDSRCAECNHKGTGEAYDQCIWSIGK